MTDILEVSLLVLSVVLTVVITRFVARKGKWNSYVTTAAGFMLFVPIVFILVFIVFAGPLMPIEAWMNQWKIVTLERHIYVGESRAALEKNFGKSIPLPDLRTCCGTEPQQNQPGSKKGHERYYYLVAGSVCTAAYQGIAVRFDRHDRITSWRRVAMADGC